MLQTCIAKIFANGTELISDWMLKEEEQLPPEWSSTVDFLHTMSYSCVLITTYLLTKRIVKYLLRLRRDRLRRIYGERTWHDIPGPASGWYIGTRYLYIPFFGSYKINKIHEAYEDMYHRYGRIVREEAVGNHPVISLFDRHDIEKVLKQAVKYPIRPPNEVTAHYRKSRPDRYTNLGLVNEQGATWQKLRQSLTPELGSSITMRKFVPELLHVTEDFVRLVNEARDATNTVIGVEELCNRLGLESTCTLILGRRFGFLQSKQIDPVGKRLGDAIKGQFIASRDTFYGIPFWKSITTPAYKRFIKCEDTIYDIISQLVEEAIMDDINTCPMEEKRHVFTSILNAEDLDIRDKRAAIIDFIAAGIKTLGNSLVFLLYLVAKRPDLQAHLYKEAQELISLSLNNNYAGSGDDDKNLIIDFYHHNAPYHRSCLCETFRLMPTAPCVARMLETDLEVCDYKLPKGAVVLCHTWRACQEECNFPDAMEFDPYRWMGTNLVSQTKCLVIPFGYGRRMCPGRRFVELELQVVLSYLVYNFEIEFDGELDVEFEFLLSPVACTKFRFKKRV